mmetsp:Transcript_28688/g.73304  ORF Transcript_28688/g.73304 Transcript_28688/m.73304 type:complete len:269 (+) Transcript_28688:500-1306(+)
MGIHCPIALLFYCCKCCPHLQHTDMLTHTPRIWYGLVVLFHFVYAKRRRQRECMAALHRYSCPTQLFVRTMAICSPSVVRQEGAALGFVLHFCTATPSVPYFHQDSVQLILRAESEWDKTMETNVKAAMFLVKEFMSTLQAEYDVQKLEEIEPRIILVSSVLGVRPFKDLGAYCVSKTALHGLAKALALELGKYHTRVNSVSPGIITTEFSKALYSSPEKAEALIQATPLRRLGDTDDIGHAVAGLCGPEGRFVTGENLAVSGGLLTV